MPTPTPPIPSAADKFVWEGLGDLVKPKPATAETPRPKRTTTLTARIARALNLEWDESLHPRDDDGKFAETEGGDGSPDRIKLPEAPERYFIVDEKTKMVPVDKLTTIRARPEGIAHAEPLMRAAFDGEGKKRKPISVADNGDGTYTVVDGNSTTAIARKHGWKKIPAHIVSQSLTNRVRAALNLDWDESLHPRDETGKFTESDGGESGADRDMPEGRVRIDPHERAATVLRAAEGAPLQRQSFVPPVQHAPETLSAARALVAKKATADMILNTLGPSAQQQVEALYKAAPEANAQLSDVLDIASMTLGTTVSIERGPIKSMQRSLEKVVNKDSGDLGNLRDPVRATMAVSTLRDVPTAVAALSDALEAKGGAVVFAEDRFTHPTKTGYRDLQINVRLPNGMIGEVQVNLKAMLDAKRREGHKYYEEFRRIDERPTKTPADLTRMQELIAESQRVYGDAWKRAGGD